MNGKRVNTIPQQNEEGWGLYFQPPAWRPGCKGYAAEEGGPENTGQGLEREGEDADTEPEVIDIWLGDFANSDGAKANWNEL